MTRPNLKRSCARTPLALAAALLAACSGASRPAAHEWQAAYDTIGDTVVVRTTSGSVWGDTAQLVADLTIGQFEGPDEYMFGQVRSLAVAPDGAIYAFDSQAMELRKYGSDGAYLGTFGREGGGPGEYRRPDGGLAVLPDGRVLLRDPANTRISVFSPDGGYLENWRIRGGFNTSNPLFVDTAGNAYVFLLLEPEARVTDWEFGLARYSPQGVPSDTLPVPSWDYEEPRLVAEHVDGDDRSTSVNSVPFSAQETWTFSPLGYRVGGVPTRYAFDLLPDSKFFLQLGGGLSLIEGEVSLYEADLSGDVPSVDESTGDEINEYALAPIAYIRTGYDFTKKFILYFEGDGFADSAGSAYDITLKFKYRINPKWDVAAGWRTSAFEVDVPELKNTFEAGGFAMHAAYSF